MKKIKTVTFRFDRNDFPKEGEWFLGVDNRFIRAGFDFEENKYDIYTKTRTEEVWKPKIDEKFYYINSFEEIVESYWVDNNADNRVFNIGNCFQTEAEAQAMADKFKELLKAN